MLARFANKPPEAPTDPSELPCAPLIEASSRTGNLRTSDHPRFFAFVTQAGKLCKHNGGRARVPEFNALQRHLAGWVRRPRPSSSRLSIGFRSFCGFPAEAGGLFVSGGSAANLTALHAARVARLGDDIRRATIFFFPIKPITRSSAPCASSDLRLLNSENLLRTIAFACRWRPCATQSPRTSATVFVHFASSRMPARPIPAPSIRWRNYPSFALRRISGCMQNRHVRRRLRYLRTWPGKIGRAGSG